MTITAFVYLPAPAKMLNKEVDWDSDDIRLALVSAAYTPNLDTHDYWDDVVANEATGTGWAAGGQALTGKTITPDTASNKQAFSAANLSVAGVSVTWRYGVIYDRTPVTDGTRPLLVLIDWGQTFQLSGSTFKLSWSSTGIINAEAPQS